MRYVSLVISFSILLHCNSVFSQSITEDNTKYKNSLFAEVAGHSRSLFSVNYERFLNAQNNTFLYTARVGAGYTPGLTIKSKEHSGTFAVPVVLSLLVGKKNNYLQLGVGYAASFGQDFADSTTSPPSIYQSFESTYTISLGYRYMDSYGLVVQIFPLLQWTNNPTTKFGLGFGISIGRAF